MTDFERRVGIGIAVYFLVTAIAALTVVVLIFPEVNKAGDLVFPYLIGPPDRQLALLALCAGIAGSFIHGAQSITSYLGTNSSSSPVRSSLVNSFRILAATVRRMLRSSPTQAASDILGG